VRCETPYPRMFEWGVIEGMTKNNKYAHPGRYQVDYKAGPLVGDLTCTIYVKRIDSKRASDRTNE
jgi:hypothetical protein